MSTSTKVIIAIFAVIMSLSMMLPSLASIFASNETAEEETQEQEADATDDADKDADATDDEADADDKEADATDDESADDADKDADDEEAEDDALEGVPDNETLQSLATTYTDQVKKLEDRLTSDPTNLAALLNLGQVYMNWGYSASYSGTTEEETTYAHGLVDKAIEYFDRYLALNDSNAVKVDRALCQYYRGDTDDAIAALEKIAADNPDYPLVWANLGMLYEQQYQTEQASDAYRKAVETDENDEYGAKSYANQRLISLNSTVSSPGDAGEASADNVSTANESGLTSTLKSDAGVGF